MMELLRELGPFHYMMNQGNVGDALIGRFHGRPV